MIKKILYAITYFSLACSLSAQNGYIYNIDNPGADSVDLGITYYTDTLRTYFHFENGLEKKLELLNSAPTYLAEDVQRNIGKGLFREFYLGGRQRPFQLEPGQSINLPLIYAPQPSLDMGFKEIMLQLAMVMPSTTPSEIVAIDTTIIFARKTGKLVDGFIKFREAASFDSVYLHPDVTKKLTWNILNFARESKELEDGKLKMITPLRGDAEFDSKGFGMPFQLSPQVMAPWQLSYSPKDTLADTAFAEIYFRPDPLDPDFVDTCSVKLTGVGVYHDIYISNSNFNISGPQKDTIDLGTIVSGKPISIQGSVINDGNLTFGILSHSFENTLGDQVWNMNFTNPIGSGDNIQKRSKDDFELMLRVDKPGYFVFKYEMESDFSSRQVYGYKSDDLKKAFYIKGRASSPILSIPTDTLNFGSLSKSPGCPSEKIDSVQLRNIGSETLFIIKEPEITGADVFSFAEPVPLEIAPNRHIWVKVRFAPQSPKEYYGAIKFKSGELSQTDSVVYLKGSGAEPVSARLHIDEIKAKPGSIIDMPLQLKLNGASNPSGIFETKLTFDGSLLQFLDWDDKFTACEGSRNFSTVEEKNRGELDIRLSMPENLKFFKKDTLITLKFFAYLGDRQSTPVVFVNPRFSDEFCKDVVTLKNGDIENGIFVIDSVCGIEDMAYPKSRFKFKIMSISPNPAQDNLNLECQAPFEYPASVTIYNLYGEAVKVIFEDKLNEGYNKISGNISSLNAGMYYIELASGIYKETLNLLISR